MKKKKLKKAIGTDTKKVDPKNPLINSFVYDLVATKTPPLTLC